MSRALTRRAAALALAVGLSACAVGPDFVKPDAPSLSSYTENPVALPPDQRLAETQALRADWWTLLRSRELDRVIGQAVEGSWTLAAVKARLARAQEGIRIAGGALYPRIDAGADIGRHQIGASTLGREAKGFPLYSAYGAGASVSYDFDMFGKTRRSVEKAEADADLAQEEESAALLALTGNVALRSVEIASLKEQIEVVGRIIGSDRQTVDLVRKARATGAVTDIDVLAAQSQLDRDETLAAPLRQRLATAQDALAVLVGKAPADFRTPDFTLPGFTLPAELPAVVPSKLVEARPDIRAAEARLHAASAAVGVAEAALYPDISLSANFAEQGLTAGPAGPAWGLLGGIALPVFHGGELTAQKKAAEDAYQESLADYRQVVVAAFGQVADSLQALGNDADRLAAEKRSIASADGALKLTRLGYGAGNASVVQVLDAQRQSEQAELEAVQATAQRYADTIGLFLAMGGGSVPAAPAF